MKRLASPLLLAGLALAAFVTPAPAHAGGFSLTIGTGGYGRPYYGNSWHDHGHGYGYGRPAYYAPRYPVRYVAPPPAYYYAPAPVVYTRVPVTYVHPAYYGYYH